MGCGKYGPKLGFISTSIPIACGIKISENKIAASGAILRIGYGISAANSEFDNG
jgi:hypothetical protein